MTTHPMPPAATADLADLADEAVALAGRWRATAEADETTKEAATTGQLAALLSDPAGLELAVRFVDRVARPEDDTVAARELSRLTSGDAASFLGRADRTLLALGATAARIAPRVVVPVARMRLRQMVGHLLVDVRDPALGKHLAQARTDGFRLNINLLGEAVLGDEEARRRTEATRALLDREDVDYVSIKVSSLVSQIVTWDTTGTVERCVERLRPLYETALARSPHAFVNLDMEEYRDLDLTLEVFEQLLSEPDLLGLEAGVVLQAYLPDALPALERLITFARRRTEAGGAGIKVRLVKGANLAMEQVEAQLHDWQQAPYRSKAEVDANYLRCVERALQPDAVEVMRVGVASHNLYDVALAHLLAERRGATAAMDVEMLQGMSPAQARAIRDTVGTVILYTPVVDPQDFDAAVSYLVRRLEENAAPENFLYAAASGSSDAMADQETRFRTSIADVPATSVGPRRTPERAPIGDHFDNTADSDPALPAVRSWAREAIDRAAPPSSSPWLRSTDEVDAAVATAAAAGAPWAARSGAERATLLREAARALESSRGELLTVMAHEAGKTAGEADPEISEAIDFARYYADRAEELDGPLADGVRFVPNRVTLITPPWNFPVAIPIGGVLAALAAGSAVIIKPAPQTPVCVETAVAALHAAGIPEDVVQVVQVPEGEVGRSLVAHEDVDAVVLTGASDTADLFAGWRADRVDGPGVLGETSGKNALIITPSADLDLAVADLVQSAFGHAGQKCSAASLAILVGSVADSERLRRQLVDAVQSVRVGWPTDLGTRMGPLVEEPGEKLRRALTTLEPGERWLVEPQQLDDTGRLWSPGLREGVQPGSFFHLTEVFGPVLGIMRAADLDEAIELQNATAYGLTGGIHSLDDAEIDHWTERVQVGNAYVCRHITGAIVQRQSFGGWKRSSVGPGAKAGGPNYVAQLGTWEPDGLPSRVGAVSERVRRVGASLAASLGIDDDDRSWLDAAMASDAAAWAELGVEHDPSALPAETNVFRYRPCERVVVRAVQSARPVEVARLVVGAVLTGTPVIVSAAPGVDLPGSIGHVQVVREDEDTFAARVDSAVAQLPGLRVRLVGHDGRLPEALARTDISLVSGPVLATGRRELLTLLREQSISRTRHRFGHVSER